MNDPQNPNSAAPASDTPSQPLTQDPPVPEFHADPDPVVPATPAPAATTPEPTASTPPAPASAESEMFTNPTTPTEQPVTTEKKSNKGMIEIIALVVIVLVLAGLGLWYFGVI